MNGDRITLLESHSNILKDWLTTHPMGHERGALILFKKISRKVEGFPISARFLPVDIILMDGDWILASSSNSFTINMRKFPEIYFRCETENLELGFVHNHPNDVPYFSLQDNVNEKNILHGLSGCNGLNSLLISLILVNGKWIARGRQGKEPDQILNIRHISVLGKNIELDGIHLNDKLPPSLERQERAFGKPFNLKLQSLRVAVIGLGGTGSPAATLLARTGIGELILIDGDDLDETNMNRVRGYVGTDVNHNKAISLEAFIKSLNLNVSVISIPEYINESPLGVDALSTCDIIIGCTDDVLGRDILNQSLYYYSLAYIDCGLSGNVDQDQEGNFYLRNEKGRVSCILPEFGACLLCQDVINDERIRSEQALKDNPELLKLPAEVLEREYYIIGGGVESPGIGAFTSGTADNVVATLMNLIANFRKIPDDLRQDNIWIDFINLWIHSNEPKENKNCIYCQKRELSISKEGKYRLHMPQLGSVVQ